MISLFKRRKSFFLLLEVSDEGGDDEVRIVDADAQQAPESCGEEDMDMVEEEEEEEAEAEAEEVAATVVTTGPVENGSREPVDNTGSGGDDDDDDEEAGGGGDSESGGEDEGGEDKNHVDEEDRSDNSGMLVCVKCLN